MKICLVGNPNCGKSTIYNLLTKDGTSTGNWSGVTVSKKVGKVGDSQVEVIDLPGVYTIDSALVSDDEVVAQEYIKSKDYDLIINVVDAANIQKSLFLTFQLIKLGKPIILVLNMLDSAGKKGKVIDPKILSDELGIKVFQMVAKKGYGLDALVDFIFSKSKVRTTEKVFEEHKYGKYARHISRKCSAFTGLRKRLFSDKVDDLLLNRFLGLPLFFVIMFGVFSLSIFIGSMLQEMIADLGQVVLIDGLRNIATSIGTPSMLTMIIADGFGGGVTLVLQFVPVIAILYLLLSLLEESGYMSRAAFILDKVMSYFGLSGKAFLPLITGFGCNVPSIIATRILENPKERIATAMMIPFMSCGARLPVYVLFCSAFFPNSSGLIIFSLYLFGIFVAFVTSLLLKIFLKNTQRAHLIMELPCYNLPEVKSILRRVYVKVKDFIINAGKLILIAFVLLKFGSQINSKFEIVSESSDSSILSSISKVATPLFYPIGITDENWPAVVGIVTGAIAKEAVIGSLGALYLNLDYKLQDSVDAKDIEESQKSKIIYSMHQRFDGGVGVYAYLLFVLLYFPCISTFAILAREFSYKWAIVSMSWSTGIAYVAAFMFYQLGILIR